MVSILDNVIKTIRESKNKVNAKENLVKEYGFTDVQAEAIVTLQLYRLSNTDVLALEEELAELTKNIEYLLSILSDQHKLLELISSELKKTKNLLKTVRKTVIQEEVQDIKIEKKELIAKENCVVSVTKSGYIKKSTVRSYQASAEIEMGMKENDYQIMIKQSHSLETLLIFTNKGNYLFYPVYLINETKWKEKGQYISNLISLDIDETIIYANTVDNFERPLYLLAATKYGKTKLVKLSDLEVTRYNKKIKYINIAENDLVASVRLEKLKSSVLITTHLGGYIRYLTNEIPVINTNSSGVKAINFKNKDQDYLISADFVDDECDVNILTSKGFILRVNMQDLPIRKRSNKNNFFYTVLKNSPHYIINSVITTKTDLENNLYLNVVNDKINEVFINQLKYNTTSEFGKRYFENTKLTDFYLTLREYQDDYFDNLFDYDTEIVLEKVQKSIEDASIFENNKQEKEKNHKYNEIDIFSLIDEDPDINNL